MLARDPEKLDSLAKSPESLTELPEPTLQVVQPCSVGVWHEWCPSEYGLLEAERCPMKLQQAAVVIAGLGLVGTITTGFSMAQVRPQDARAVQPFLQKVDGYVELRRQAALAVPPLVFTMDPWIALERMERLATAIRARRPAAKAGDIFVPESQQAIRRLIDNAICGEGLTAEEVVAKVQSEFLAGAPRPEINQRFPWQLGAAMPQYVTAALPPLPKGLQYRIVDWNLVLWDLDSNLVVDIFIDALKPIDRPAR